MKKATWEEKSAGGVVYRAGRETLKSKHKIINNIEFLIGKHSGYHKWVLPKGLVERGESEMEAAVREVEEEVGVKAEIVGVTPIKIIEYWYYADLDLGGKTTRRVKNYQEAGGTKTRVHKKVVFYLMELETDLGKAGWEMEERKWVSYEEGMKLLAFETERGVLEAGQKALGAFGQSSLNGVG